MRDEAKTPDPAAGNLSGKIPMPSREKTWDECGIEDKVERLRRVMREQKHMLDAAWRTASAASDLARQHQHNPSTGAVLSEVNRHGGGAEAMGRSFDPLA